MAQQKITKQSDDFSQWYIDTVLQAGMADYAPVKGCMVIKPYGYAIWELLRDELDWRIKSRGVSNVSFPLLIPQSLLAREKDHVANRLGVGQQHHQAVDADSQTAGRRHAVFKSG